MVHTGLQLVVSVLCLLVRPCLSSTCDTTDISPCRCSTLYTEDYYKITVNCTGHELESVPNNLPEDVEILDFSDNFLGYGDLSSLCQYAHLQHVSIAMNHITTIGDGDLIHCKTWQSLNLAGNVLKSVTGSTLSWLKSTRTIFGLEADHFTEDAFSDMSMLAELEMNSKQHDLPVGILNNMKLQSLKLEMPNAIRIPEALLNPLGLTLTDFELTSVLLRTLPESIFSQLKVLQNVTLRLPDLRSMSAHTLQVGTLPMTLKYVTLYDVKHLTSRTFESLSYLRYLAIHGSLEIPTDVFHGLRALEILELEDLVLDELPVNFFQDLGNLKTLKMTNTGVSDVKRHDLESLNALENLDMSNNRIRILDDELFYDVSDSMLNLNLSHNNLKNILEGLFAADAVLETLDLSKNSISNISMAAFILLTRLERLYLQNNKISTFDPDTFALNVNLFYLDMSSNVLIDLPVELFENLERLMVLKLSDNNFSNFNRSIIFNITTLNELDLSFNPIKCNCGTAEFINRLNINGGCKKWNTEYTIEEFIESICVNNSDTVINANSSESVDNVDLNTTEVTSVPSPISFEESPVSTESLGTHVDSITVTPSAENEFSEQLPTEEPIDLNVEPDHVDGSDTVTASVPFTPTSWTTLPSLDSETNVIDNVISTDIRTTPNSHNYHNMSDDVVHTNSTSQIDLNSSGIQIITSLNRVTVEPNKVEESDKHSDNFYISLGSILSVAVLSFLILAYLYYKRKRSRHYEIPRMVSHWEGFSQMNFGNDRVESTQSMTPLKEVPSIQIESVDDEGNIRVELYTPQTGTTKDAASEDDNS